MDRVPIIDLGPLLAGTTSGHERVAHEIGSAAREIGFFAVANHGIADTLIHQIFSAAHAFFTLPESAKSNVAIERSPHYLGFTKMCSERLDPTRPGDVKESFNMGREILDDDPDYLAGKPFVGRNQWPELASFRPKLLAYYAALQQLGIELHRAIALDLGIDANFFAGMFARPLSALRMLHYPPHPGTFDGEQHGAGPHTDYGNITLLAQDENGGLEVRTRSGRWIAIEPVAGTFVCNIGDALMRWSNDVYVSNPHRVINRSGKDRYSVAFFCEPNADTQIACLPECSTLTHPPKYAPITFGEYLRSRIEPTYAPKMPVADAR